MNMSDRCRGGQIVQREDLNYVQFWGLLEVEIILPVIEDLIKKTEWP